MLGDPQEPAAVPARPDVGDASRGRGRPARPSVRPAGCGSARRRRARRARPPRSRARLQRKISRDGIARPRRRLEALPVPRAVLEAVDLRTRRADHSRVPYVSPVSASSRSRRPRRRSTIVRPLAEEMVELRAARSRGSRRAGRSCSRRSPGTAAGSTRHAAAALHERIDDEARRARRLRRRDPRARRARQGSRRRASSTSRRAAAAATCCSAGGSARTRSASGTAPEDGFAGRQAAARSTRNRLLRNGPHARRTRSADAAAWWERLAIVAGVLLATAVVARLIDRRIARSDLRAEAATRYRVLRRTITTLIFLVGVLSALLVIPQVRAVAGGLLASSAVLGLVIGFAARSTLANWVAGLMIALTQPLRLGDTIVDRRHAGHGRGDRAQLHVHPHARQRPARDPEREAGLGYHQELDDRQPEETRRGHRSGSARHRSRSRGRCAARRCRRGPGRRGARDRARRQRDRRRCAPGPPTSTRARSARGRPAAARPRAACASAGCSRDPAAPGTTGSSGGTRPTCPAGQAPRAAAPPRAGAPAPPSRSR